MSIEAGGKFQGSRGGGLLETEPGIVHSLLLFRRACPLSDQCCVASVAMGTTFAEAARVLCYGPICLVRFGGRMFASGDPRNGASASAKASGRRAGNVSAVSIKAATSGSGFGFAAGRD